MRTALLVMFMVSALCIQIIQILQFLRMDTKVEGKSVLAVVLPEVETSLRNPISLIRQMITKANVGRTFVAKDFLVEDSTENLTIVRGINSKRRKCDVIYLEYITEEFKKLLI